MTTTDGPPDGNGSMETLDKQIRDRLAESVFNATDRLDRSVLGRADQVSLMPALSRMSAFWALHPVEAAKGFGKYYERAFQASVAAAARSMGADVAGPVEPVKDKRFADPAWKDNPYFWWVQQQYLLLNEAAEAMVEDADISDADRMKAAFTTRVMLDALAPTNFAASNPAVLKRTMETGGASLARGMQTFMQDLATNEGQPHQVAQGVHEVGRDLAVTPGKVVFRNEIMELIQYTPTTGTVHEIPLLFSPPWINKYYIVDLSPGRSLVEWAVSHGHTVFLISYRNPDESMRNVRLDDYLLSGPMIALDVIADITGSETVNLLGVCLGGTLTMATLAYLNATGAADRIHSATFLNTMTDFSKPGALGVFTDENTVAKLERTMAKTGFLKGDEMRKTFDYLRGNDLIWNYVVNNWLLGQDPPAFDLLTWNADSTRMPADMHSFYLRSCYLENQLAQGKMELAGQHLDMSRVDQDLYFLAAEQDHIAPWRSSYIGARLPSGDVRFVLSNSGHIAGIVNPPNPKSRHYVGATPELPEDPEEWFATATMHPVTWWEDWANWIEKRGGDQRTPPPLGSEKFPVLGDAPGTYVFGK
ncbi:MAG TPA: class I poly(R)-hydroxyalkanoic acid synthase [Nakamurella sp.]|nr:class I poly(R)-hydroxyalkanoic acid synthase [Nakamurella sp.]